MRPRPVLLGWLAPVLLSGLRLGAQEAAPPARAFVEVKPSATSVWLHEPVDLLVRVGFDAQFFATDALPLFQQRLDEPFQVTLPWLFGAEDRAVEIVPEPNGAEGRRIATGDRTVVWRAAGQREVGGRTFELREVHCRWLPLAAGTSTVAPVEMRYAFATRFEDDLLRGRQPLDRQEASVQSAPLELTVKALPVEGRPAAFKGAVGEFTARASANVATVAVGGTFSLEVAVEGTGNFGRFAPMVLPPLPGLHVQGFVERRGAQSRTYVFDVLALRAGLAEVPAVPFVSFSPRTGGYVTAMVGPVPMKVVPAPAGAVLPERVQALVDADAMRVRAAAALPWWWYAMVALVALVAFRLWRWRRQRARRAVEVHEALARLDVALACGPADALAALQVLCAQSAGTPVLAADAMFDALLARGVPDEVVARVRRVHAQLDAARYGGAMPPAEAVLGPARELVMR
ncbi:MAG TPA: BatD family protein [Planctomycetota bacterium]|nr:BatD family protein [Planctomycetota bacterium]